jgi:signal peptidase I
VRTVTDERLEPISGEAAPEDSGSALRTVLEWVVLVACALLVAFVVKTFVFQAFYIPSESMVPTLAVGDRVLVNKLADRFGDPDRFDIEVFRAPEGTETAEIKDLVKRVVGLPDETIEGRDGRIYIDGKLLEEPFLPPGTQSRTFGPVRAPSDPSRYLRGTTSCSATTASSRRTRPTSARSLDHP